MTLSQKLVWAVFAMLMPFVCAAQPGFSLLDGTRGLPHLAGTLENAHYLCVTAGERLYCIGDQAGGFPEVGFHIPGEMGGVWQQPIKLLDGFRIALEDTVNAVLMPAEKAGGFTAYSFATQYDYKFPQQHLVLHRTQFVPDTLPVLVVELAIDNNGTADRDLRVRISADVNLMPVWLGERTGMVDSTDGLLLFETETGTATFRDHASPWYAGVSVEGDTAQFVGTEKSPFKKGKGITGVLVVRLHAFKGRTSFLRLYVSGSMRDQQQVNAQIALAKQQLPRLFQAKKDRYIRLEQTAALDIPDTALAEAYRWGKYSTDWLRRDVPDMGRAMSAGLPDYPWFFSNDQAATFSALVGTIEPDLFYSSWKMLKRVSNKANQDSGRIIHEVSSNGAVYDKGRMEESQEHIIAAWNIFRWTGDLDFLEDNYAQGRKIWTWLQRHDTDHNGYIEGYGGVEIAGLNAEMLDVQVQTVLFLEAMGHMAEILGDNATARTFYQKSEDLRAKVNRDWWLPDEHRFADFISSKGKALSIIDSALANSVHEGRNMWAKKKLTDLRAAIANGTYKRNAYVVYYNANMGLIANGVADSAKAVDALRHVGFFTNKFGAYVAGIDRPDDVRMDEGPRTGTGAFSYQGAVMPVATADLPIAACRYGEPDTALAYMHMLLNSFSFATPGTMYEVSPDYGMFVQAWNIRGFDIPIIQYFFGIDPLAYKKEITLRPGFPSAWGHASIRNVIVGENRLTIDYQKNGASNEFRVTMAKPGWTVQMPLGKFKSARLNGKDVRPVNGVIRLTGKENTIAFMP